MKYISILAFLLALNWTWDLVLNESGADLETHTSIQEIIVNLIAESVAEKRPNGVEVAFKRIWTEPINDNRIKASFKYEISNQDQMGSSDSETITGHAIINRVEADTWSIDTVSATNTEINFKSGVLIGPQTN